MKLKSSKKTLMLVLLAFIVPVILAKLALEFDWFNKGATNHGELLNPVRDLSGIDSQAKWRILYRLPEHCDATCDNALYSISQVWKALGRKQDRAEAVVVATVQGAESQRNELAGYPTIRLVTTSAEKIEQVFEGHAGDGIFLVDTLNNVILHYPVASEREQAVLDSRDILSDLLKLLKLSRIG
ncbi:hypothetical protein [Lacimicrobium alkaliphilum]|uniref:Thioredoxin domain-containing protein n=1 Tax=Lacimicrobium alkaliphilum TaxID=1526571 RepID=A0ABQ1RP80_9ALTE|nr:hypothetical protein [Lacimicrobium alkaliphilum]GGD77186.1 hypothetical protein GCM10011357_35300 [Lacimicrobium alkaliphilum]